MPHLARRHLSPAQVGREPRGALRPRGVPAGGVAGERALEEGLQARLRARLARSPDVAELGRPGPERLRLQGREGEPRGSAGAGGSAWGAGRGSSGAPAARRARQNGVNTVYGRPSRVRTESGSASRLAWGATTAPIPRAASAASRASSSAVSSGSRPRAHTTASAAARSASAATAATGSPRSTTQSRAQTPQVAVEARERVPEPPARRAAGRPGAALPWFPHVDRQE